MKRSIYIFILFLLSQIIVVPFAAFAIANFDALSSGGSYIVDLNAFSGTALGQATLIANLLLIATLILCQFTSSRRPLTIAFRKGMPQGSTVALVGFVILSLGISLVLSPLDLDDLGMVDKFAEMKSDILCIIALTIVGPIAEELTFRDGITREMMTAGAHPWAAIVTSALTFAIVHGDPAQMVPAAIMGIALGWLYWKTGDVRLCIPAHILNNSVAIGEMYFPEIDGFIGGSSPFVVIPVGVVILAIGTYLLSRIRLCKSEI